MPVVEQTCSDSLVRHIFENLTNERVRGVKVLMLQGTKIEQGDIIRKNALRFVIMNACVALIPV